MRRRTVLTAVAIGLGGCLGSAPPVSSPTSPATASESPDPKPVPVDVTFTARERCPVPGAATVAVEGADVTVDGCVRGANGCYVASTEAATWHPATRTFSVVVAAVERRRGDVGCTQALVDLGYELAARLPESPARVRVVHDDVDGRRTVARGP